MSKTICIVGCSMTILSMFATSVGLAGVSDTEVSFDGESVLVRMKGSAYKYPLEAEAFYGIRQVFREDLDGDGVREYVVGVGAKHYDSNQDNDGVIVLVCGQQEGRVVVRDEIHGGDYYGHVELVDITGDGLSEVVVDGGSGMHSGDLEIWTWRNGTGEVLWNTGNSNGVTFSIDDKGVAQVDIGKGIFGEVKAEKWRWSGDRFKIVDSDSDKSNIEDAARPNAQPTPVISGPRHE